MNGVVQQKSVRRRSVTLVLVVISLIMIMGFAALSVDVGLIYKTRGEAQRSVDAAALAGASGLWTPPQEGQAAESANPYAVAHARAYDFALRNEVNGDGFDSGEAQVSVGHWDTVSASFTPHNAGNPRRPNAVRVVGRRTGIPLFFAPVLGSHTTAVTREAVAIHVGNPCQGIWGLLGVTGDGSIVTDSYNVREGAYGTGPVYQNGDLCSCRDIELNGAVTIHGDAMHGDGYGLHIEGQAYVISGIVDSLNCDQFEVPEFDMAAAEAGHDNANIPLTSRGGSPFTAQWDLRLTATDNLVLPPGNYFFTSANVDGLASITVTGPTRIYVDGPAVFTGNSFSNTTLDPNNLIIYASGPTVTLTGTAGFVGTLIAPEADVILPGTGQYYGAILGRTVDIDGNAVVHVEESVVTGVFGGSSSGAVLVR